MTVMFDRDERIVPCTWLRTEHDMRTTSVEQIGDRTLTFRHCARRRCQVYDFDINPPLRGTR